jgi:CheY-like chemotaxis protein
VDDDDQVRRAAHAVLENAGYEVLEAATGGEAIAFLEHETRPVDVVLLDMVMPGMDGPATARALQERGFAVPIIAMSGTESRQTFPGARGALSKPFTVERLVEAVREAVTRG